MNVQYRLYVEASEFVLNRPHMWGEGLEQQFSKASSFLTFDN